MTPEEYERATAAAEAAHRERLEDFERKTADMLRSIGDEPHRKEVLRDAREWVEKMRVDLIHHSTAMMEVEKQQFRLRFELQKPIH